MTNGELNTLVRIAYLIVLISPNPDAAGGPLQKPNWEPPAAIVRFNFPKLPQLVNSSGSKIDGFTFASSPNYLQLAVQLIDGVTDSAKCSAYKLAVKPNPANPNRVCLLPYALLPTQNNLPLL